MTDKTEAQRLADVLRGFRSLDCHQAAAELLRLDAEVAVIKKCLFQAQEAAKTLAAEVAVLRDALHRVKHKAVSLADAQVIALEALSGTAPARKPLTDEQREQVSRDAESSMVRSISPSWLNAIVEALEADPFGPDGRLYALAKRTPETLMRFAALAAAEKHEDFAALMELQPAWITNVAAANLIRARRKT